MNISQLLLVNISQFSQPITNYYYDCCYYHYYYPQSFWLKPIRFLLETGIVPSGGFSFRGVLFWKPALYNPGGLAFGGFPFRNRDCTIRGVKLSGVHFSKPGLYNTGG